MKSINAFILKLAAEGLSDAAIGERVGLTANAVQKRRVQAKFLRRNGPRPMWSDAEQHTLRRLFNEGKSDIEIAKCMNRTASAISNRRRETGMYVFVKRALTQNRWTPEENEAVIRYHGEGYSNTQIAEAIGRTSESVKNQVARLGLRRTPPPAVDKATKHKVDACTWHLVDLIREHGGGTLGEAKAVYRSRHELSVLREPRALYAYPYRFEGSACSSSAGWD